MSRQHFTSADLRRAYLRGFEDGQTTANEALSASAQYALDQQADHFTASLDDRQAAGYAEADLG